MKESEFNCGDYDIFAVPFNFKYKRMDKYSTLLSFTFCGLFLTFSFIFFVFILLFLPRDPIMI